MTSCPAPSAVWIQVDGSDTKLNERVARELEAALRQAESEIMIPDGVIPRAGASEYLRQHPEASMDDVLRCDIPLKVEFGFRRLSRDDIDERATLAMINGLNDERQRPVLVPVFGRGRMLDAIPTENVSPDSILGICSYMVSECSCTVKSLNPGTDLLLNVDWQQELGANIVMVDSASVEAPELLGIPAGLSSKGVPESSSEPLQEGSSRSPAYIIGILAMLGIVLTLALRPWRGATSP